MNGYEKNDMDGRKGDAADMTRGESVDRAVREEGRHSERRRKGRTREVGLISRCGDDEHGWRTSG